MSLHQEPVVLTIATHRNSYVQEYEDRLKDLGYSYKLLGMGQEWKGFEMKMELSCSELELLGDKIVIMCDSYDLLFLQSPKKIMEKYHELAEGKLLIGLENITDEFCNFSTICLPELLQKCKIKNPYFPNFKYPNAGFLMGPASILLDLYQFMKKNKFKDDQYNLFMWCMENCEKCFFDYHFDIIFTYFTETLINNKIKVQLTTNNNQKELIVSNNRNFVKPAVIHMPGHYLDLGVRSERIRNFYFPERQRIQKTEYFKEFYGKLCKPEFNYFGYWWWILFILFVLIIVLLVIRSKNNQSK